MKVHSHCRQSLTARTLEMTGATALSLLTVGLLSTGHVAADQTAAPLATVSEQETASTTVTPQTDETDTSLDSNSEQESTQATQDSTQAVTQANTKIDESSDTTEVASTTAVQETETLTNTQAPSLSQTPQTGVVQNDDGSYSYYDVTTGAKSYSPGFVTTYGYAPNGTAVPYTIYVQADGNLATGLQTIDQTLYYFDGYALAINQTVTVDGLTYTTDHSGQATLIPKNSYYTVNGNWYFADANGNRLTGAQTIDGVEVYFDRNGKQAKGIFDGPGFSYYFYDADTGAKWTNRYVQWEGNWYYLDANGRRSVGLKTINGQTVYFGVTASEGTGQQVKGKLTPIYNDTDSSHLYYFDQDTGEMWKNRYVQWQGSWYYLGSKGYALTGGEAVINGDTVYFHEDGKQAKGEFVTENGVTRYYDENTGARVTNTQRIINGTRYTFDENGTVKKD